MVQEYFLPPTNFIFSTSKHTSEYYFKSIVCMLAALLSSLCITVCINLKFCGVFFLKVYVLVLEDASKHSGLSFVSFPFLSWVFLP